MPAPSSSIHILGIGNLGKLLAHSLRKNNPDLPITLLFHRQSLDRAWEAAGREIEIVRNGQSDRRGGFECRYTDGIGKVVEGKIENLIVTTKAYQTAEALRPVRGMLDQGSTVLFCLNGMGTIDDVTSKLFPTSASRPNYFAGILNHGVYANSTFSSVHAGLSTAVLGPVSATPSPLTPGDSNKPPFLAQKILGCPELAASFVSSQELFQKQLQKLVINAVINPLTAIFDRINGDLFIHEKTKIFMDNLIAEISRVMIAILESRYGTLEPALRHWFSAENLKEVLYDVGAQVAKNISSMRQDYKAGRQTEIDYINGYIVRQGGALGVETPINEQIVRMVKDRVHVDQEKVMEKFHDCLNGEVAG